jgi:hypothetical protein
MKSETERRRDRRAANTLGRLVFTTLGPLTLSLLSAASSPPAHAADVTVVGTPGLDGTTTLGADGGPGGAATATTPSNSDSSNTANATGGAGGNAGSGFTIPPIPGGNGGAGGHASCHYPILRFEPDSLRQRILASFVPTDEENARAAGNIWEDWRCPTKRWRAW